MLARASADAVVVLHGLFVVFVVAGWLPVLRWPRLAWIHIPAAIWGALIEFAGWLCPLTPLENRLRAGAGDSGYEGGFIENYFLRFLYPDGLQRSDQIALGISVLVINVAAYSWLVSRRARRAASRRPASPS